jgi:uncharacterized protein (TIGR02301 family)
MALKRLAIVLLIVALVAGSGASAAESTPPKPAPAPAAPSQAAPAAEPPPPYQPQLLRLAEIMGALAYLRDLCGEADGAQFRTRMAGLLDAQGSSESQRDLLAGAYNRGFEDYEITYRACTPAAEEIVTNFLAEMARLAGDVANRYGG